LVFRQDCFFRMIIPAVTCIVARAGVLQITDMKLHFGFHSSVQNFDCESFTSPDQEHLLMLTRENPSDQKQANRIFSYGFLLAISNPPFRLSCCGHLHKLCYRSFFLRVHKNYTNRLPNSISSDHLRKNRVRPSALNLPFLVSLFHRQDYSNPLLRYCCSLSSAFSDILVLNFYCIPSSFLL